MGIGLGRMGMELGRIVRICRIGRILEKGRIFPMGKINKFVTSLAVKNQKIGKVVKETMIVKR